MTPKHLFAKHQPYNLKTMTELTDKIKDKDTRMYYNGILWQLIVTKGVKNTNNNKQSKLL